MAPKQSPRVSLCYIDPHIRLMTSQNQGCSRGRVSPNTVTSDPNTSLSIANSISHHEERMRILAQVMGGKNVSSTLSCHPHKVVVTSAQWDVHNHPRAKWWFHFHQLPPLNDVDLVWFLDSDMDAQHFDCSAFMRSWSKERPMISQPTIKQKSHSEFSELAWSRAHIPRESILKSHWI